MSDEELQTQQLAQQTVASAILYTIDKQPDIAPDALKRMAESVADALSAGFARVSAGVESRRAQS